MVTNPGKHGNLTIPREHLNPSRKRMKGRERKMPITHALCLPLSFGVMRDCFLFMPVLLPVLSENPTDLHKSFANTHNSTNFT